MPSRKSYKSKFEREFAATLKKAGVPFRYEAESFDYPQPVYKGVCNECGASSVTSIRSYTPDWFLGNGVIIETKGRLMPRDRRAIAHIKHHHGRDIRLLFLSNNKLSKNSKTRYLDWCAKHDIPAAVKKMPKSWAK